MNNKIYQKTLEMIPPLSLLLLWELFVLIAVLDARFFPAPHVILISLWEQITLGYYWHDVSSSLIRITLGFVIGSVVGVAIGISIGISSLCRALFEPIVAATFPIPKLALMPLIILLFGLDELGKVIVIAIGVLFPVIIQTTAGISNVDQTYKEVAYNYGASRWNYFKTVALPAAAPSIFIGLKLGSGMAILLIVAAEMQGASAGIGYRIWSAYSLFDIPTMFVALSTIALLGYLSYTVIEKLEHRVISWHRSPQKERDASGKNKD
ncbi:ABC transporter permease [Paenibacillus arenosi]|uniref:ABC transporter permease n=1 Tax=Paenibacillus arenosi TaxID=2774142 RepID=A0ABR9B0Q6_9BACL|nr:ABC transporter permease [Paenibacillus arenosi]MBD8499538.1 ABC transporter permease [Paenibacillus arenosi]